MSNTLNWADVTQPLGFTDLGFIDSHTAGEPTRVILGGFPELPGRTLAEQRLSLSRDFDDWRRRVNTEPRGNDVLVSALLVAPVAPGCAVGVIFFNNVGPLWMCGHGTIGVISSLAFLGQIGPGVHRIDTPAGVVSATLHDDGRVSVANVASYRWQKDVAVQVPGLGEVRGDVAYGGNWFFLTDHLVAPLEFEQIEALTAHAWLIRQALTEQGVTGEGGAEIDHIELMGKVSGAARNFVLCPGGAYDRSPCGTGTSAKLACLAADKVLAAGQTWVQQSIIGSTFEASYQPAPQAGRILPTITGRAYITAQGHLIAQPGDPFAWGIGAS